MDMPSLSGTCQDQIIIYLTISVDPVSQPKYIHDMKTLVHLGDDQSAVDLRTVEARWSHPSTKNWLITTQAWAWDEGQCDALVVLAENYYRTSSVSFVVIRMGDRIEVVEGSLHAVMGAFGYAPSDYTIKSRMAA